MLDNIKWEQLSAQAGLLVIAAGVLRWLINTTLLSLNDRVKAIEADNKVGEERHREYDKAISALDERVKDAHKRLDRAGG